MTPNQLSKSGTEHAHQVALFAWAAVARLHGFNVAKVWAETGILDKAYHEAKEIPCLKWLHAIHNQGHGDAIRGGRARAEGVRSGIPDIFLPHPTIKLEGDIKLVTFAGLYIELKKPSMRPVKEGSKGGKSDEQIEFGEYAIANGYQWKVAYGWSEAAKIIQDYLS